MWVTSPVGVDDGSTLDELRPSGVA
jgi:hypothetical protein